MGFLGFLPNDEKFNVLFKTLASQCVQSIEFLEKSVLNLESTESQTELSKLKQAAKQNHETLTNELCLSFITPFDREDLLLLGFKLYKIVKLAEKIKDMIVVSGLKVHEEDFVRLVSILKKDSHVIEPLIKGFINQKLKEVQKEAAVLNQLEGNADVLLMELVQKLCANKDLSFQEVIIRKDIYEMFEKLTDLYRDSGNIALQVILKHS